MKRHKADRHPHHAGHRHAGTSVGENASRGGPQPGQNEFSADEEKAMRAGGPGGGGGNPGMSDNDADDTPTPPPGNPGPAATAGQLGAPAMGAGGSPNQQAGLMSQAQNADLD